VVSTTTGVVAPSTTGETEVIVAEATSVSLSIYIIAAFVALLLL
jgi:hypothetical protein